MFFADRNCKTLQLLWALVVVHDCDVPRPSVAADAKAANLSTEGGITRYYMVHFISATALPYPSRETPATCNSTKETL